MNKILSTLALGLALALPASASSPAYKTMSASGNAAAPATVIFSADPALQIRLVGANYTTDTNNSTLAFSGGATAFAIVETNTANSTNGLSASAILVLQHNGTCYAATVSSWSAVTNSGPTLGTNVVLASGGWGVATSVGDSVYLMDTPVTIPATATAAINGEAIYVAALSGRPVLVKLSPAAATNQLNTVTARYE
jgi:hypothetical protein